jgi:hypothetical protein
MSVRQMEGDCRRFVQYQLPILENGDEPIWIELQVGFLLVNIGVAIDGDELVLNPDLVEQDMRQQTDIAWVLIQFDHDRASVQRARLSTTVAIYGIF